MPAVKKQKPKNNKSPKSNENAAEKQAAPKASESVVSGQLQKKINKIQPKKDPKGVVFIKHLPHGFFEEQLKKYFEQFGKVTRVRLARSRRTGNSKGYAFVEFEYPEVAEVAAETMDNYLMFKKIVKAAYIPPEKQQFNYFRTSVKKIRNKSGKIVWVSSKTAAIQQKMKKHNDWSEENYQKRTEKQLAKLEKIGKKYAHLGIDINEIIAQPKTLTEEEKKAKAKAAKEEADKTASSSKATKRKTSNEDASTSKQNSKKSKKKVSLEDLLGNTIQEDSEDEDYIAMGEDSEAEVVEEDADSSDEETYGFAKGSDNDDSENESDEDEEEEVTVPIVAKKSQKKNFGKSLKTSNVERFDQMLKRKPHTGGISKFNKKSLKQPTEVSKNKSALQMSAAKAVAKPLSKVKGGKLGKPLKANKNLKKVK